MQRTLRLQRAIREKNRRRSFQKIRDQIGLGGQNESFSKNTKVLKSKLFWRIYLTYSGLFSIVLLALGIIASSYITTEHGRFVLAVTGATGIFVILCAGLWLARRVAIPISEMMRVCQSLREGRYDSKVETLPEDEMGLLGDTLNRLGGEITHVIDRISHERAQLKTILAGMVEGIVSVDHQQRVLFCNSAAYNFLNPNLEDCRNQKLIDIEGFCRVQKFVDKAQETESLVQAELIIGEKSNERVLDVTTNVVGGDLSRGAIIVMHDVTHLRRLERVRQDFVANVSHELKTPLTSIKGYTETLLDGAIDDPENNVRFLRKMNRNAGRLVNLVQDILSLARIENEEHQTNANPVDINAIINQVINQREDSIKAKNLTLDYKNESSTKILGLRESVIQVFENLLTNAIRYTPAGGEVKVSLKSDLKFVRLTVSDTGIGISKNDMDRIFERFYRVDKARSRDDGGTGLGLSIVKHLVSNMSATISVDSVEGMGSTFTVKFLRAPDENC